MITQTQLWNSLTSFAGANVVSIKLLSGCLNTKLLKDRSNNALLYFSLERKIDLFLFILIEVALVMQN